MNTLVQYVSKLHPLMFRPYAGDITTKVMDLYAIGDAVPSMIKTTMGFLFLSFLVDMLTALMCPLYWQSLPDKKKSELAAYVTSTVHHLYVVPCGIYLIYLDINRGGDSATVYDYDYKQDILPFIPWVGGYLISDIIYFAFPDALKGKFETFGHHILGLGLVFMCFFLSSSIARFIPHLLICEASAIVFNLAWLLKTFGPAWRESKIVRFLEYTFALSFTLTRVVNMPFIVVACVHFAETAQLKMVSGVLMGAVCSMQFYWFFAILRALGKKQAAREKVE